EPGFRLFPSVMTLARSPLSRESSHNTGHHAMCAPSVPSQCITGENRHISRKCHSIAMTLQAEFRYPLSLPGRYTLRLDVLIKAGDHFGTRTIDRTYIDLLF